MEDAQKDDIVYEGQIADERDGEGRADGSGGRIPSLNDIASSVKEVAQKTGEALNKATEQIGKALDSALATRGNVVMVRVNDETLKRIDELARSGIFKSRSEAAAFLIGEGISAQSDLFRRIEEKISEIERLRSELKSLAS